MKLLGRSKRTGAVFGLGLAVATLIQFGVSGPVLAADAGLSTPPAQTTTPAPSDTSTPAPTSTPTSPPTAAPTQAPIATDIPGATATASQAVSKIAPQIVGGEEATIADAPWQVALIRATASDEYQGQFCGGSLIAAQWVLTAAHCVVNENNVVSTPTSIRILAGQDTLSQETNARAVSVSEIKVHPLYSADADHDDIALIKLTSALTLEPGQIQTIALPWTPPSAGKQELITGWGTVEFDTNNYPTVLRKATVSVFNDQVCADSYASFDPEKMFCAGSELLDRDTCQGDSGGPSAEFWNSASTWVLAGVTSFGAG
jgi:secreted trypsin-like serine protease